MELELWPGGKEHPPVNPRSQIKDWEYGGGNLLRLENANLGTSSQKCQFLSSSCSSFPKGRFGGVSSHPSWCPAWIGIRIGIKIRIRGAKPIPPPKLQHPPPLPPGKGAPTPAGNCAWNHSTGCSSSVGLGISRSFFFPRMMQDAVGCYGMVQDAVENCGMLWDAPALLGQGSGPQLGGDGRGMLGPQDPGSDTSRDRQGCRQGSRRDPGKEMGRMGAGIGAGR